MSLNPITVGSAVPPFDGESTGGPVRLADHDGKVVVLYFYPKDSTPGCTTETQEFGDRADRFGAAGATVFGVSRDSMKSHHRFRDALGIPIHLISDPDETLCAMFGVMKTKNMYGKSVRGVERSTFVIGRDGTLAREWRGVKVPGHVDEVLRFVEAM